MRDRDQRERDGQLLTNGSQVGKLEVGVIHLQHVSTGWLIHSNVEANSLLNDREADFMSWQKHG